MAQITYANFLKKVRDWANRDSTALPDDVIGDAIRFSSDEANRRLKIPALEACQFYYVLGGTDADGNVIATVPLTVLAEYPNAVGVSIQTLSSTVAFNGQELQLPVPVDTTTFISLRITQSNRNNSAGVVFNEKVDIRTYFDQEAHLRNANVWMRQADLLHVIGLFGPEDVLELFYHKRLPDPDALYDFTYDNFINRVITFDAGVGTGRIFFAAGVDDAQLTAYSDDPSGTVAAPARATDATNPRTGFVTDEVFNWLRDENVRVLLFGALYQCFDYLGDAEMKGNYATKFASAIEELNEEEKTRTASGGNVQMNYSSHLLSGGAFF